MSVTNLGGHVVEILAPDRAGRVADVTLGYRDFAGYLGDTGYFGSLVGRYANCIAKGRFTLDGKPYSLVTNNGPNALHGGPTGFQKRLWAARVVGGPRGEARSTLDSSQPVGLGRPRIEGRSSPGRGTDGSDQAGRRGRSVNRGA